MDISWAVPAMGSLFTSGYNIYSQRQMNKANLKYQRERDAKNEALMRESWVRDDNAVSRRAADLQSAGISPLMAAGAAAANSGPVSMQGQEQKLAPQLNFDLAQSIAQGVGIIKTFADMQNQKKIADADEYLKKQQAAKLRSDVSLDMARHQYQYGADDPQATNDNRKSYPHYVDLDTKIAQLNYLRMQGDALKYDLDKSKIAGARYKDPIWAPLESYIKKHEGRIKKKEADYFYWGKGLDFFKNIFGAGMISKSISKKK